MPAGSVLLALIAIYGMGRWKFGPESVFLGLIWGAFRVGGTYFIINGAPLAGSQPAATAAGIALIGTALLWQLQRARRKDWMIAVIGGSISAAIESVLIWTTMPWPRGTLELGLVLNIVWSGAVALIGLVSQRIARVPLGRYVFALVLPLHLWLLSSFYPLYYPKTLLYYPKTLLESQITARYPIPWAKIPIFALSLYFYIAVGLVAVVVLIAHTMIARINVRLSQESVWGTIWTQTQNKFIEYFEADRPLSPCALLIGLLLGSLTAFLITFSELWFINRLATETLLYLFGLSLLLLLESPLPPRTFMVVQATNLFLILALAVLRASFGGFQSLIDFWSLIEDPLFAADIPGAVIKSFIVLVSLGVGWRRMRTALNSSVRHLGRWLVWIRRAGLAHLRRMSIPKLGIPRWAVSFGQSVRSLLRTFVLLVLKRIEALGSQLEEGTTDLRRALISRFHSPRVRSLARSLGEITRDNLMLNVILLFGFWLDVLGFKLGAVVNAARLFRWDLSNPLVLQFLLLEIVTIVLYLTWRLVNVQLKRTIRWLHRHT